MAGFQFVSPDIAVDIGTDNTRVYVKEKASSSTSLPW